MQISSNSFALSMVSNLSVFFLQLRIIVSYLRNACQSQVVNSTILSFRSFIVLSFHSRSIIHVKFILGIWYNVGMKFSHHSQQAQYYLLKIPSFPPLNHFCHKSGNHISLGPFLVIGLFIYAWANSLKIIIALHVNLQIHQKSIRNDVFLMSLLFQSCQNE